MSTLTRHEGVLQFYLGMNLCLIDRRLLHKTDQNWRLATCDSDVSLCCSIQRLNRGDCRGGSLVKGEEKIC